LSNGIPNGNKTIALTPNMKFNPYIFCSSDTDKENIKKINKPPIIIALAWSIPIFDQFVLPSMHKV
jgi:hypothetical protein